MAGRGENHFYYLAAHHLLDDAGRFRCGLACLPRNKHHLLDLDLVLEFVFLGHDAVVAVVALMTLLWGLTWCCCERVSEMSRDTELTCHHSIILIRFNLFFSPSNVL